MRLKIQLKSFYVELVKFKSTSLLFPESPRTNITSYYPDWI